MRHNNKYCFSSSSRRGFASLSWLWLWLVVGVVDGQQCTVCSDGTPVPKPNHPLELDVLPVNTCGELDLTVNFLTAGSTMCALVNAVGPLCGCYVAPGGCDLCGQTPNAVLTNPSTVLEGLSGLDLLPDFPAASQVTSVYCELLQAVLLNQYQENTDACSEWQNRYSTECGCLAPTMAPSAFGDAPVVPVTPAPTPAPRATSNEFQCTFCANGQIPPHNTKAIRLGNIPADTCAQIDSKIDFLLADSVPCQQLRYLGPLCGCNSILDNEEEEEEAQELQTDANATTTTMAATEKCSLCHDGSVPPIVSGPVLGDTLHQVLPGGEAKGLDWNCELLHAAMMSHRADSSVCTNVQLMLSTQCGCAPHPDANETIPPPPARANTNSGAVTTTTTTAAVATAALVWTILLAY